MNTKEEVNIDSIIKRRKTQKVLPDSAWPIIMEDAQSDSLINELLELAASAPYHYASHSSHTESSELKSTLPFRFYVLDSKKCRITSEFIDEEKIAAGKIKNMLDAADVLFIVTWLPEPTGNANVEDEATYDGSLKNMEHIAAASSAIQNVLIGATSRNIPNYWSSGGVLRKAPLRDYLSIPTSEILLGAIFLFPKDAEQRECFIKPGGLRDIGKELSSWSKKID